MNKSSSYFVDIIPVTIDPFLQCACVLPLLLSIILTPDSLTRCHLKQLIVINYFTFNNYDFQLQSICNFTQFSLRELFNNLFSFLLVFFLLFQVTSFLWGLFVYLSSLYVKIIFKTYCSSEFYFIFCLDSLYFCLKTF